MERNKRKKTDPARAGGENKEIVIYTDGGSRGNPGPAAVGVYIPSLDKRYFEYVGVATNNVAEYRAIVFALKKIKQILGTKKAEQTAILIRSDSQLAVNQLSGFFRMKEEELFPLFIHIWNLKQDFDAVSFVHVPREENKTADALVNEALDRATARTLI